MDNSYKKSKGNAGLHGVQFQVHLVAVCLLNALHKLKNWRISTENENAAKLDDIVIELSDDSAVFLQAKSKTHKKITKDQLLSFNAKNSDFSLPKYFFSYCEISTEFKPEVDEPVEAVVICTNTNVDRKGLEDISSNDRLSSDSLLYYDNCNCSVITFNENILPDLEKNAEIYYEKNLKGKDINKDVINYENLIDFLEKFQIIYNFPSEDKLNKVTDKLLSKLSKSNLLKGITSQELYKKLENWFKQSHGEYLTESRANSMFCEIKSDKYCATLEDYNVFFECNDLGFTNPTRIFHLEAEKYYLLQVLKIYRALRNIDKKALFVSPNYDIVVQKQTIEAFRLLPQYVFLVLILPDQIHREVNTAVSSLTDILEKYIHKKVVLVCRKQIVEEMDLECDIYDIDGSVSFLDLDEDSQDALVTKENVLFQGDDVNLTDVLDTTDVEGYAEVLSSEILEKLVKDKISIGFEVKPLDNDIDSYYIHRTFERQIRTKEIVSENKIFKIDEKVILIQDDAGVGKSTVLAHLAWTIKESNSSFWVILIKLNDYTEILDEFIERNMKTITILELINSRNATRLTNKLEELVFSQDNKVVLLLDGVDEISPDYTNLILNLLDQCRKEANFAKLFVTTRPHLVDKLEETLKIKSFKLQPFTHQDQISFLTNYWFYHLKIDETDRRRCEEYAVELLFKSYSWVNMYSSGQHLASVPLHVMMLAEIFSESSRLQGSIDWGGCKEFLNSTDEVPNLPHRMNIARIYEIFIGKKRDVFRVKGNERGNTAAKQALIKHFDGCLLYHRRLALQEILQDQECKLFKDYQESTKNMEDILKMGILQKAEGKFYFCHRTFAEYFVAESLLNQLQLQVLNQETDFQKFFFNRVLLGPEFKIVRDFLNSFLQKYVDSLPSYVFESYESLTHEFDLEKSYDLIHKLAKEGCETILQILFRCVNYRVVKGREAKIDDLFNNHSNHTNVLKVFKCLVDKGGVNVINSYDETPLSYAVESGDLVMTKFLIDHGAKILDGMLYGAIKTKKDTELVAYLLEKTLEQNGLVTESPTIPYAWAHLGRVDKLKDLVDKGLDVNTKVENDKSLIFGAAFGGQLKAIRYLVDQGADINSRDKDGHTALHLIAKIPSLVEASKLLLELGTDVNSKNKWGNTVLYKNISDLDILELLVEKGADVNTTNRFGESLYWKAIRRSRLDSVQFHLAHGCDVNMVDEKGHTALHYAVKCKESEIVKHLLRYSGDEDLGIRMDPNIPDTEGRTPLHTAIMEAGRSMVMKLVQYSADVNAADKDGRTPLHLAAWRARYQVVKYLVGHAADINVRDAQGCTPLHLAVAGKSDVQRHRFQCGIARFLVERGADVNLENVSGDTAFVLAKKNDNEHLLQYLDPGDEVPVDSV